MHSMKISTDAFLNLDDLTFTEVVPLFKLHQQKIRQTFWKYEIFEISIIDDQIIKNFDHIF